MTAIPKHRMTADEFLAWSSALPREAGKFELINGEVIVVRPQGQSERAAHWEAKGALYSALKAAIDQAGLKCHAVTDGASVRVSEDKVVEPDALVYCGDRVPRDSLKVPEPIIVVEVLSPTTPSHILTTKLEYYLHHPTIRHYLFVDTEAPRVIHHDKVEGDRWLTRIVPAPVTLRLDPPGLDVDLAELFEAR